MIHDSNSSLLYAVLWAVQYPIAAQLVSKIFSLDLAAQNNNAESFKLTCKLMHGGAECWA